MWIISAAWLYVTVMMALAEATNPQGTVLGAVMTFLFYGLLPLALVLYIAGTPSRRRARQAAEARAQFAAEQMPDGRDTSDVMQSAQANASGLPAGDPVASKRKEP